MNHALVNKEGKVVNVIWWTGDAWTPPVDHLVIRTDIAGIGDTYDHKSGHFTKADGKKHHRDKPYEEYIQGK